MNREQLRIKFREAIEFALEASEVPENERIQEVTEALILALSNSDIRRYNLNEAYDRLGI